MTETAKIENAVLGGGEAGKYLAWDLARQGRPVIVIDRALIGGSCPNVACLPIIGASPGKIGTAIAQQHLRSILAFCNSPLMNAIEAYIQFEDGPIGEDGGVSNESTKEFLRNYMAEFHAFIARVTSVLPRDTWMSTMGLDA